MTYQTYKKILKISLGLILAGLLLLILTAKLEKPRTVHGGYGANETIRGWAWSENIGWVNFNCYNNYDSDGNWECCCPGGPGGSYCPSSADDCPHDVAGGNYSVQYNSSNYKLTGYAWASENSGEGLGWVCFGETCCSGACNGELADKAPDGYDAWACVGRRQTDGTCAADCGEDFNHPITATACAPGTPDTDMKGRWTMNSLSGVGGNVVTDDSGNSNHGTLSNGFNTSTALVAGKWNNALKFDGIDDYVSVPDNSGLGLEGSAWTVEAWIKPLQLKNYGNIFEKFPGDLTSGWGIITFANGSWYFQRYAGGWANVTGGLAGALANNVWTHIAVTYDGTNVRTYTNGVLVTTQAQGTITDNALDLHIGADIPYSRYFNGLIDNVAIYSRAKTAEEIWDDAHIEVSGWAKVVNMDDKGWLKLKGQTTGGSWWGTWLNNYSQGGGFYSVGGFGWQTEGNEEMGPDANLVGHWKMNGDWTDSSGYGNNGTGYGDATWTATGRFEKAGTFDGSGDYVEVANNNSLNITTAITIEAWIKTSNTQGTIVSKTNTTNPWNGYILSVGGDSTNGKICYWPGNYPTYSWVCSNSTVNDNNWHHIAVVHSGTTAYFYKDGNPDGSVTVGNRTTISTSNLRIARENATDRYFNGLIDNVAIVSRAKTATEIQNDYYKVFGYLAGTGSDKVIPFGWFKGSPSITTISPGAFDTFRVTNYGCIQDVPNLYLRWTPSPWAEYYNYYRIQKDSASLCPNTCRTGQNGTGYNEYPVQANACGASECNFQDNNTSIELIEQNKGYCYCIRAFNETGNTWATSNPPTYPVPYWKKTPFCPPTNIGVDGSKCGYNKVVWQPSVDMATNAEGYNLYRSLTYSGCSGNDLDELISSVATGNCEVIAHLGEALTTFDPSNGNNTLVAWWKMNEVSWNGTSGEVWDSSGNNNHGTASGNARTIGSPTAKFNRSGDFDGSEDYVEVADNDSLDFNAQDFTLEFWLNIDQDLEDWQSILDKSNLGGKNTKGYNIYFDDDTLHFRVNDGGPFFEDDLTATYNDFGNWHHVAAVFDVISHNQASMYLYIDGVQRNTRTTSKINLGNTYNLRLGSTSSDRNWFDGKLDNVAIYNYAKSAIDILKDAEASPLETLPSGINNSCALGNGEYIPIYCPDQTNPQNCGSGENGCTGTGSFCLTCSNSQKCCRFFDKRIVPNIPYFYRVTVFTNQGGESPGSTLPSAHINGCLGPSSPSDFRRACDKSICRPPIKTEEK